MRGLLEIDGITDTFAIQIFDINDEIVFEVALLQNVFRRISISVGSKGFLRIYSNIATDILWLQRWRNYTSNLFNRSDLSSFIVNVWFRRDFALGNASAINLLLLQYHHLLMAANGAQQQLSTVRQISVEHIFGFDRSRSDSPLFYFISSRA